MTRLLIHVEGQTEEEFVNGLLAEHLYGHGFTNVSARMLGKHRSRKRRGGVCGWKEAHQEIFHHLSNDQSAYATTFVDFYALPEDWPGRVDQAGKSLANKFDDLQKNIHEDFRNRHGPRIAQRFIPFVAMHEFEALLFSDPDRFSEGIYRKDLAHEFSNIRAAFETPEHINDNPETSPSKRIISSHPQYSKVIEGNLAAHTIGLQKIRIECPLFDRWITRLEKLTV